MRKFYACLLLLGVSLTLKAQTCSNAANANTCTGTVTQNFNTNDGAFTSPAGNFTYNPGSGYFNVNPASRNSSYTITSGTYVMSATGGVIGFSKTGSAAGVQSITIRVRDAITNQILFQCNQNSNNFISANQICVNYSGLTVGTQVRYEFVITTNNGASGDGLLIFDNFSNGASASDLPVKLEKFNAGNSGSIVLLTWNSQETNVNKYEIQRSADGRSFQTIGSVKAENKNNYSFSDDEPSADNNYYRLRIVDINGDIRFSHIVSAKNKAAFGLKISPNPVRDRLYVQHPKTDGNTRIQIRNTEGKLIRDIKIPENAVLTPIDLSGLNSGMYLITYKSNIQKFSQTIIKN